MNFDTARFNMIEQQIRPWEVIAPRVVDALFRIKRENFVPGPSRHLALADSLLPIGHGERMLLPGQEGRLVNALQLQAGDKVLEVGTGSGYVAALLGALAGQVSSVELRPDFVASARAALRTTELSNVAIHEGDGLLGLPGDAPFDAILLSGAVHAVPRVLLEQLKPGGRLVAIVGTPPVMFVERHTRVGSGEWQRATLFETSAPYLREAVVSEFEF